jgi:uncharacterized protein
MNEHEVKSSETFEDVSCIHMEEGFYIGGIKKSEVKQNKLFIDHSCEPIVGIRGQVTFVVMRDIKKEEELTYDWAIETDESYFEKETSACKCSSPKCRKILTLNDWRIKAPQKKYGDFFSSYILERIIEK